MERPRYRALVPTGNDAPAYTCVRSLAKHGVGSVVASEKSGPPAAASKFCDEAVDLPPPREDLVAYRDALLDHAAREDVETVVPIRCEDGYVLSKYRDAFEEHVSLVVPPMDVLANVHDRLALADAAERAGVPVPETRLLSAAGDWDDARIVKSRYNVLTDAYVDGFGERDVDVVKDLHHVEAGERVDAAAVREEMHHDPIVQEFVDRDGEYMVAALCEDGDVVTSFQHRQLRGNSYTGGGGVYRRSMYDPDLESVAVDLLEELEFHGLACIEYMQEAGTGDYVLTEINPRMWQSLPSTVHAGADFPWYYWLAATDRTDEIEDDYEIGVGTHYLHGEVGHLASVLTDDSPNVSRPSLTGTAWTILASIAAEPHFDYLKRDDPAPFFAGLRTVVQK
jgi:predicted ATP-grasp superfamily ATP-dependent carboligase